MHMRMRMHARVHSPAHGQAKHGHVWVHAWASPAGMRVPRPSALSRSIVDCRVLGGPWRLCGLIMWSTHGLGVFVCDLMIQIACDHDRTVGSQFEYDQTGSKAVVHN